MGDSDFEVKYEVRSQKYVSTKAMKQAAGSEGYSILAFSFRTITA
jgi:hypothetical protein